MAPGAWCTAANWKRNPLFRVLAFLDNAGVQPFHLRLDCTHDGTFTRPEELFSKEKPIAQILAAGLEALRDNIGFLFINSEERDALFEVIGVGRNPCQRLGPVGVTHQEDEVAPLQLPDAIFQRVHSCDGSRAPAEASPSPDGGNAAPSVVPGPLEESTAVGLDRRPKETAWGESFLHPTSFAEAVATAENRFPLHVVLRLIDVLGIPLNSATDSRLLEQILIDALDRWMQSRAATDNDRIVLACGVQPAVLEAARKRRHELPDAVIDFVIDVVFPPPVEPDGAVPLDWLILSYEKNHESIEVDDTSNITSSAETASVPPASVTGGGASSNLEDADNATALQGCESADGEVILTANNIEHYMRTQPQIIPRDILREKRKHWSDATITDFELQHHYTAAELRAVVKDLAALRSAARAADSVVWHCTGGTDVTYSVSPKVLEKAARATRKADYLQVIHALQASHAVFGEPAGKGVA